MLNADENSKCSVTNKPRLAKLVKILKFHRIFQATPTSALLPQKFMARADIWSISLLKITWAKQKIYRNEATKTGEAGPRKKNKETEMGNKNREFICLN